MKYYYFVSYDSSESFLPGIKALKNSIGIPSGPHALKLGVYEFASLISSSLIPWLISHSWCLGFPKFLSTLESFPEIFRKTMTWRIEPKEFIMRISSF